MEDSVSISSSGRLAEEDRNKQFVITVTFSILIPSLLLFSALDYFREGYLVTCIDISLALLLILNLILIRIVRNPYPVYRATIIAMYVVMFYVLALGKVGGQSFIAYYFVPLGVFYLFGFKEGCYWVAVSLLISITTFFFLPFYQYDFLLVFRHLVTYTVVIGLSAAMELTRARYQTRLLDEKEALTRALDRVHTLQGLLPICSNCKKIRDDSGYWNQLEHYISTHSDVQFSHGLCPECKKEFLKELEVESLSQ